MHHFLALISLLAFSFTITALPSPVPPSLSPLLTGTLHPLARRNLSSSTQNDLNPGSPCKSLTVIFARGTVSPGNMGETVGPPFVEAIGALIGVNNIAVQGVNYSADIFGFIAGGSDTGSVLMANLTVKAMEKCPGTKVVMGGYSQGGQLVHKAAKMLNSTIISRISSVVIFGDPLNGTAVGTVDPSKVLVICHAQDLICKGQWIVDSDHLNYANDAGTAAAFVAAKAGL